MSDEQRLLAVIAAIYLADCIYWIPRSGLGFTRWLGKFWRFHGPSMIFGNQSGALGFANPLPPLGLATRGIGWTISISKEGIFSYTSAGFNSGGRPAQKTVFAKWSEIKSIERDAKKIFISGEHFATAATEYSARWLANEIARLQKLGEKKRAPEIENLIAASCDSDEINRRVGQFQKQTWLLKYFSNWLFLFLFGACPFLVWKLGMVGAIWPMVIGIYAQTIIIALLFSKLHRKIYPFDSAQVFKPFLTMLLAAPSAIRAQDILARPLLESFHPLAVAKALCAPEEVDQLAATVLRDLQFPRLPVVPAECSEAAKQTELQFRETLLKSLRRKIGFVESNYMKAPVRSESVHTGYCPRCLQQFTESATDCPDCWGRPLLKF
jgi:hypothetical protein